MPERPARETLSAALAYIEQLDRTRPFFVWIHLIDPHGPYAAPVEPDRFVGDAHGRPGLRSLPLGQNNIGFANIPKYQILDGVRDPDYYVARYDAEIRYADDALGGFFARLRELDLYDRTLFVITADHGETLDEPTHRRYFSHQHVIYEETARIPLIVREPSARQRLARVDTKAVVFSIDVAPTILDLLGVAIPDEFEGRSLLSGTREPDEPVFSSGSWAPWEERTIGTQRGVRVGPWRYVRNTLDGVEELYDHREDPREEHNVAAKQPEPRAKLRRLLDEFLAQPSKQNRPSELSPEDRERLRALGYAP
jgi:arylsulfatase A-like enzyme